ncbi:calcium-activated chloride channel regulator 2-like isoform X2 [Stegodyphus dumicola]|uniref:calcium-activated chloride channel regulator 2-like isoform X2 n=1 Tax=Stegodyphus dumicola TaxID=202533 RepID=UPI0015AB8D6B|nr:calcium-activated chloride channel regulator 2-like isoform X2 [Stegodyphus dumicola]
MHVLSVKLRIVILLFIFCRTHGKVTVENGAYKDILVRFSPRVNSEDGGMLLEKMKEVLTETSEILGKAVRLKISNVIFLLPRSWDISKLVNLTVGKATPENTVFPPDILIDNVSNSAFGNYPFALQYGGCMVPGRQISIQENFLTNEEDFPKGKLLAREWLKFYFGVFDENGFPDDTMYPLYYKVPGNSSSDIKITDCTHPAAEYYFKKGEEDCTLEVNDQNGLPSSDSSECEIRVREDSRNKVHSSLMYFHRDLTQVDFLCGDPNHSHNSDAPNKHNTLCNGKSITEVVRNSGIDLSGESTGEISFSYVQEKNPSLAIAWQDTDMLNNQTEVVKNSFWRFLYDVPKESKIALYEFSNDVETVKDLDNKNLWPYFHITFTSRKEPCVTCALSKAVNVIKEDDSGTRGYVIIITAANPDAANTNYTEVVQQINSSQLCLIVIGFTNLGATSEGFQELVSASRCGSFWGVSTKEKDDEIFAKLYRAMETVLPSHDTNYVTKIIGTQHVEYGKLLRIQTNEIASKFTLRVGSVFDLSKHFSCIETNGNALVKLSKEGPFSFSFPSQEDDVECSLTTDKLGSVYIQIQMTTKLNQYFEEHTWVKDTTSLASNSPASVDLSTQAQMPVIIYAQINYGGQPVQNAMVKAKVTGPNGNGEWNLDLLDDGLGDPDITANDGIYSRYFLNFNDKGEYTVVITASDNNLQAKIGQNGPQPCCGSKVVSETVPIGAFQEFMKTTFSTISGKPEGGYKPSRILDLHIIAYDMPSKVSLQWTAPGAEADTGQVIKYVLRAFTSRNEAVNFIESNSIALDVNLQPKLRGGIEKTEIEINNAFNENTVYYIAIRSVNSNNQSSETSNIVKLLIPELFRSTTLSYEITTTRDTSKTGETNKIIGIVIGIVVLVIVLIICIYLAIYFCVLKPKRKEEEMEEARKRKIQQLTNQNSKEDSQTENHVLNPLNSIPADVLVKHHNEVVNAKIENKNPPIFDENKVNSTQSGPIYENKGMEVDNETSVEYSEVAKGRKDPQQSPKTSKLSTFV